MMPPGSAIATARWTSLRSCRTLPGQAKASKRSSVAGAQTNAGLSEPFGRFPQEKRAEVRDLFAPVAEGRHVDADDAQPVEEVFAKLPVRHSLLEIGVGGRDHAHVDALRARVADRQDFALLQKAQQLRLDVERKIADFVEEERAAERRPKHAWLVGNGAGEAAATMAEELTVGELSRGARAVVGQEHAAAPRRPGVDGARDEVLAGAALARNQHGEVVALHALNLLGDALHGGARADESRQQRLERPLHDAARCVGEPLARGTEIESLPQNRAERAEALAGAPREGPGARHEREPRALLVAAEGLDRHGGGGSGADRPSGRDRQLTRARLVAARRRFQLHLAPTSTARR